MSSYSAVFDGGAQEVSRLEVEASSTASEGEGSMREIVPTCRTLGKWSAAKLVLGS
eukprot:CAMPEP_0115078830 /NCGR_PEP_ID=MMETSP0227-20121206/17768_1 /TAXON_ID=89957 /ORGANISM="Polarella glacialis, Strain CCMP 1383" /LENGTH=55 /DNA_ID=CAMNT_0002466261 /DNA_START=212 /DNA_END=375 /DNA_ORIENTATION=+